METISAEKEYLFSNRDLRNLIIPLFIEQVLAIFVGLADSVMVASVGEAAVSAVSLIDSIMLLLNNLFLALATGGAIVAGQALGCRKREEGCEAVEQTLLFSAAFSLVIAVILYVGKWFILHVLFGRISPEVMRDCNTYLVIVTLSVPFIAIYNSCAAMLRAMGDSRTPMNISLVMNLVNLGGNAILLYGLKWGVEGAAVPTSVSRIFAGMWILFLMKNPSKTLYMRKFWGIRLKWKVLKKILHLGLPYSLENSMFQLGKLLVLSLVSGFGTASIAANAVGNTVCSFAIMGGMSIGYALSAVGAQCVGAADYEQARFYTRKMLRYAYVILILMNLLVIAALPFIIFVYNLSPETGMIARRLITYYAIMAMIFWAPSFALPNMLRAANDVSFCMWVSVMSMWIFRIGCSYLLGQFVGMGIYGVWIATTVDWIVRVIFFITRYRGKKWEKKVVGSV